jgi:hypothetical protein
MFANPDEKLVHTRCLTVGDEHCEFETLPTSEKDRKDFFGDNRDWSHVDPRIHGFYEEKENESH